MEKGDQAYDQVLDSFVDEGWIYEVRGPFKIMAIADNYAMCRFKGCMPFVVYIKDLRRSPEECEKVA